MIDGDLRKIFRDRLRRGIHWQSIETGGTGRGIPDSNYCTEGVEGWVEFKATEGWAVGLTPEQVGWHLERWMRGGWTHVATRRRHDGGPRRGDPVDELWIAEGCWVRELATDGLRADVPMTVLRGGPGAWDWDTVRRILVKRPGVLLQSSGDPRG